MAEKIYEVNFFVIGHYNGSAFLQDSNDYNEFGFVGDQKEASRFESIDLAISALQKIRRHRWKRDFAEALRIFEYSESMRFRKCSGSIYQFFAIGNDDGEFVPDGIYRQKTKSAEKAMKFMHMDIAEIWARDLGECPIFIYGYTEDGFVRLKEVKGG